MDQSARNVKAKVMQLVNLLFLLKGFMLDALFLCLLLKDPLLLGLSLHLHAVVES
jgi:hypothetical protein